MPGRHFFTRGQEFAVKEANFNRIKEVRPLKDILMIATGGTIASKPRRRGWRRCSAPGRYSPCVPGLADICQVESRQLFDLDSTNMRPEQWLEIAACIEENYDRFDGFVVTHGTDTLAYTAAALS